MERRVLIVQRPAPLLLWVVVGESFALCVILIAMMLNVHHWLGEMLWRMEWLARTAIWP